MMKLEDLRPTPREEEATADMPEQVAIGWIRAKRRDDLNRSMKMFQGSPLDRGFPL